MQQHACGCRSLLSGVPRSPPVQPDPLLPALPPHGVFSSRELPSLLTAPLHAWSLTFCFSLLVSFLGWIVWWRPRVGASCRLPTRTCAWLLGSCPPAARGWGWGWQRADVTFICCSHLPQISSPFSPNQFTFIASAAQKQFFKNKKVSTSKTNQFWESSCRHRRGSGGPAPHPRPPPAPSRGPITFIAS